MYPHTNDLTLIKHHFNLLACCVTNKILFLSVFFKLILTKGAPRQLNLTLRPFLLRPIYLPLIPTSFFVYIPPTLPFFPPFSFLTLSLSFLGCCSFFFKRQLLLSFLFLIFSFWVFVFCSFHCPLVRWVFFFPISSCSFLLKFCSFQICLQFYYAFSCHCFKSLIFSWVGSFLPKKKKKRY